MTQAGLAKQQRGGEVAKEAPPKTFIPSDSPYTTEAFDEPSGVGGKYLRICQSMSAPAQNNYEDSNGKPWKGQFYLVGSDETDSYDEATGFDSPLPTITIVPLGGAAKRNKWVDTGAGAREIQCRAIGGKFADLVGEGLPGGPCAQCPESKWKTLENGKKAIGCDKVYSFIVYVLEWEEICVWDLARTAAPIGRWVHKQLHNRGGGDMSKAYSNCAFELTAVEAIGTDFVDNGDTLLLADTSRAPTGRGRQGQQSSQQNRWYVPEATMLEGDLADNNIFLPVDMDAPSQESADDNAPEDGLPF